MVSTLREGRRVIAVVLGERSPQQRSTEAAALVEAAYARLAAAAAPPPEAPPLEEVPGELPPRRPLPGPPLRPATAAQVAAAAAPPTVLEPNECGYGTTARLPGHGIVLGTFTGRGKALSVAESTKERYGVFAGAGTAAIPSKMRKGRYNAVLIGLSQREAQDGCRAIRKSGGYCLVLSNQVLNNPAAVWR